MFLIIQKKMEDFTALKYAKELLNCEDILKEKEKEIERLENILKKMNDAMLGDNIDYNDTLEYAYTIIEQKNEKINELKNKIENTNKKIKISEHMVNR